MVAGRSILPGAAMMELAAACGTALADAALRAGNSLAMGLRDASIPAPVGLPAPPKPAPLLECTVGLKTGLLEVSSAAAGTGAGERFHHLQCAFPFWDSATNVKTCCARMHSRPSEYRDLQDCMLLNYRSLLEQEIAPFI